ncbi:MAG: hypothetical protein BA066_07730 [Candidatus Korarchaeota archaeon NZ13-K]|nr:MAG: hypothetical protein BA066_07730 [Candidatus Korarchaeota archaeon NZ13-K]
MSSSDIKAEIIAALRDLREALKPKAAIFDLDGVLVDSSERYRLCESEAAGDRRRFWECFLSEKYMDLDRPRTEYVETLRRYAAQGYRIIIVTGRVEERQKNKTLRQLSDWGITFHEIYFRRAGDYRKDYEFKSEIVRNLSKKYRIVAVFEDSKPVAEALRKLLPDAEIHLVQ